MSLRADDKGGAENIAVPTTTSSRMGFVDEFPGRMPSRTTMGWKGCRAHFAYRQQNQIQLVLLVICDRSLFRTSRYISECCPSCRHIRVKQSSPRVIEAWFGKRDPKAWC
jgi:hypothetical protein